MTYRVKIGDQTKITRVPIPPGIYNNELTSLVVNALLRERFGPDMPEVSFNLPEPEPQPKPVQKEEYIEGKCSCPCNCYSCDCDDCPYA